MQPELWNTAHDGSGANDSVPPIERMANELAAVRKIIADLLRHVGTPAICTGPRCRQPIIFVRHYNGRYAPYNENGTPHYGTCVDAKQFHDRGKHG